MEILLIVLLICIIFRKPFLLIFFAGEIDLLLEDYKNNSKDILTKEEIREMIKIKWDKMTKVKWNHWESNFLMDIRKKVFYKAGINLDYTKIKG